MGRALTVDLVRPASDFPNIVAGPTFGVVPPGVDDDPAAFEPGKLVASGGYIRPASANPVETLTANPHYWAGTPAIGTIELVFDLGGRSEVAAFEADEPTTHRSAASMPPGRLRRDARAALATWVPCRPSTTASIPPTRVR
jgi:hypothetical protein